MAPGIRDSHPRRPGSSRHVVLGLLQSLTQAFLLFFIISSLIGRFEIEQTSMEPNFHEGQRVVVNQLGSVLHGFSGSTIYAATGSQETPSVLRRGQVIVLHDALAHEADPLIKRLIGLPGDTLEIRDGDVWLNDEILDEPYVNGLQTDCAQYCGPLTLGPEEYYVMGDNRPVSRDSRYFGPIVADQIVGHVFLRYWPVYEFAINP
jgi:signal peptidase I